MAETGSIALILALIAAIYAVAAFLFGGARKHKGILTTARFGVMAVCVLITIAELALALALIVHDFQIDYVFRYSSQELPLVYVISALWAGNSGSLLFWAWLLSIFNVIVVNGTQKRAEGLLPYTSSTILLTEIFFLFLLILVTSPFTRILAPDIPADGLGLNPLLQSPGMIFHPPLILGGYVAFTVPFAFAIAALIKNNLSIDWIMVSKRWAILAWFLLGLGNIIGAWWAYTELGWGGYWAWDPVENAGLMPWLTGTALVHSIVMQRRRGIFKTWNFIFAVTTFCLVIFGTFLTRSDILASVHSFGESTMGTLIAIFLGVLILSSVFLLVFRRNGLKSVSGNVELLSKENTFTLSNWLFIVATAFVFFGTISPFLTELIGGEQITVREQFFNLTGIPVMITIVLLAGICVLIRWKRAPGSKLKRYFFWPAITALIPVITLLITGVREWHTLVIIYFCAFTVLATLLTWLIDIRKRHRIKPLNYLINFTELLKANKGRYGGYIVHLGIIVITIGVVGSSIYDVEKEVILEQGESVEIGNYSLTFNGIEMTGSSFEMITTANISVYKDNRYKGLIYPEQIYHHNYNQPVSEVAIRSTLVEDLYAVLVGWERMSGTRDYRAAFLFQVNPLVSWLWVGGGIFFAGGLISLWSDIRKRNSSEIDTGQE